MNWITRMQQAICYIEDNLTADVTVDKAARVACASKFHFHRMFHAMTGITPADYIRRRKLTLAATELTQGKLKVIDVAIKYGYESHNAFTRAFRAFHGINPGKVCGNTSHLSTYNRASSGLKLKGQDMLAYRIVEKPSFQAVGKSKDFSFDEFVKDGPAYWKDYVKSDDYQSLWALNKGKHGEISEAPLMSVYLPQENGDRALFTDLLAIEQTPEMETANYQTVAVPKATYAEFTCTYNASMKTNRYIYSQWFAATGYERDGNKPDIAAYFPMPFRPVKDMLIRWWIPVIKKDE